MEEKMIRVECKGATTLPLDRIVPLQGDLKTISPDKLRKLKSSIIEYGISSPTQVWVDPNGTFYMLDGHQRLIAFEALQKEGWTIPEIPVVFVEAKDIDEAREKLLVATSAYGEFSASGVERYIQTLKNRDRIKNAINLSNVNLNRIYAVLNSLTDPDETPVVTPVPTITRQGDLWICGKHKIICGDSRDKSIINRFGIDHFELCLTDPPFGISYQPEWRKKFDGSSNRKSGLVLNDDLAVFEDTFRNIDSDVVYCFHASTKSYEVLHSFTQNLDYNLRAIVIWVNHYIWGTAYSEPELLPWLFSQHKGNVQTIKKDWKIQSIKPVIAIKSSKTIHLTGRQQINPDIAGIFSLNGRSIRKSTVKSVGCLVKREKVIK